MSTLGFEMSFFHLYLTPLALSLFSLPSYSMSVAEDSADGFSIGPLVATDPDAGQVSRRPPLLFLISVYYVSPKLTRFVAAGN